MATSKTAIILPSTEELKTLPRFAKSKAELDKLNEELTSIEKEARELVVRDKTTFDTADRLNKRRKEIVKLAEHLVEPYKSPLRKWMDFVQQHFNIVKNHAEQAKTFLEPKMEAFQREDARRREEEERRLNEEQRKRAQEAADAQLKANLRAALEAKKATLEDLKELLRQKKLTKAEYDEFVREAKLVERVAVEKAEEASVQEVQNVPTLTVESNVRKGRTYYHAECADWTVFLRHAITRWNAGDKIFAMKYLAPNNKALDEEAEVVKDSTKMAALFPGVKATDRKSF